MTEVLQKTLLVPPGVPTRDIPERYRVFITPEGGLELPRWKDERIVYAKYPQGIDTAIRGTGHIRNNSPDAMERVFARIQTYDTKKSFSELMDLTRKSEFTFAKFFFVQWLLERSRLDMRTVLSESEQRLAFIGRRSEFQTSGTPRQREQALRDVGDIANFAVSRVRVLPYVPAVEAISDLNGRSDQSDVTFAEWLNSAVDRRSEHHWRRAAECLGQTQDTLKRILEQHQDPRLCCPT